MKLNNVLLAGSLLLIMAAGCKSKSTGELIVNKWHLYDMAGKSSELVPDSVKAKMYKEATIEFKKDGKFEVSGMGPAASKGKYTFTDGKTLVTIEEGGIADTISVVELTADKLVVQNSRGDDFKASFKSH